MSWENPDLLLGCAMILAFGMFAASWFVHFVIWHIRRPVAYPVWLPLIFSLTPLSLIGISMFFFPGDLLGPAAAILAFSSPLYAVFSACYMGGYAGIIEYSPSAEILKAVRSRMPQGMPADNLEVETLTEEALTGKRIRHLVHSGCATMENGEIRLTPKGRRFMAMNLFYRKLLLLKDEPKG
jgi:predicted transcriptional regulator